MKPINDKIKKALEDQIKIPLQMMPDNSEAGLLIESDPEMLNHVLRYLLFDKEIQSLLHEKKIVPIVQNEVPKIGDSENLQLITQSLLMLAIAKNYFRLTDKDLKMLRHHSSIMLANSGPNISKFIYDSLRSILDDEDENDFINAINKS